MDDDHDTGKLELLFAHLSINNITHIKPLLIDAIDEYQSIRGTLAYDEKKNVNFIKSLLWHAERAEWTEARNYLNGAQTAYQNYLLKKVKDSQSNGYAQIHGRKKNTSQSGLRHFKPKPEAYMHSEGDQNNRQKNIQNNLQEHNDTGESEKITAPYRSWKNDSRQTLGSASLEEQGPSTDPRGMIRNGMGYHCIEYPGAYSRQFHQQPGAIREKLEVTKNIPGRSGNHTGQRDIGSDKLPELDPNRPTKIADSYMDLYQKEWRHALSSLNKTMEIQEEKGISCLLYIVLEAYRLCMDEARTQVLEFEMAALNIITDGKYTQEQKSILAKTGDAKLMVTYRKEIADLAVKRLQDTFITTILPVIHRKFGVKQDERLDTYARQCIAVTWRISIQDPPLHIDEEAGANDCEFDTRLYKPYTKSGKRVLYDVWPVLRLYKGGPVLCRGVAQGDGRI